MEQNLVHGSLYTPGISRDDFDILLDRMRRDVTRSFVDFLQTSTAQRGPLVKPVVEEAKASAAPATAPGEEASAGTPLGPLATFAEAQRRFMAYENEPVATRLLMSVMASLSWHDTTSCRRGIKLATLIVELGARQPQVVEALGGDLFREVIKGILDERPWMTGLHGDLATLAADIYRYLVIGEDVKETVATLPEQPYSHGPRQCLLMLPGEPHFRL
jgi:hypothetical protein